jgi:hypothetical protein
MSGLQPKGLAQSQTIGPQGHQRTDGNAQAYGEHFRAEPPHCTAPGTASLQNAWRPPELWYTPRPRHWGAPDTLDFELEAVGQALGPFLALVS